MPASSSSPPCAQAFRVEHLKQMVGDMSSVADTLVASLRAAYTVPPCLDAAAPTPPPPPRFDLFQAVKMATMDTIGLTGFGTNFGCSRSLQYSAVAAAFELLLDDQTFRSR